MTIDLIPEVLWFLLAMWAAFKSLSSKEIDEAQHWHIMMMLYILASYMVSR